MIPNNDYWGAQGRAWDLAPDGRFLLMKPTGQASAAEPDDTPRIRVVVNWVEELKRLVPLPSPPLERVDPLLAIPRL